MKTKQLYLRIVAAQDNGKKICKMSLPPILAFLYEGMNVTCFLLVLKCWIF